jgi:ferrochelatase
VPIRKHSSARKYKSVWLEEGSPLTVYTEKFAARLRENLGESWRVAIGYRHATPTIGEAVQDLRDQGAKRIVLASLFPQSAPATTGSIRNQFLREAAAFAESNVHVLTPFYRDPWFIEASAGSIRENVDLKSLDHLLFSYHGLPVRALKKLGCRFGDECCLSQTTNCYRGQCIQTTKEIVRTLGVKTLPHTTTFQSRLGPTRWLEPSTFATLTELARKGVKRVGVVCPSFVTDCIETLEEIGIQAREIFLEAGGEEFHLIPCLNADRNWVDQFSQAIQRLQK